jgi:spore maturation protein CgeB
MKIILNYRHKNERLEEALQEIGYTVVYGIWDIEEIKHLEACAVIFEFKQILKEELRFIKLSYQLKRAGIPTATWCLDLPNIGASPWKLPIILKTGLIDVFATHSIQGLDKMRGMKSVLLYLPNAAWLSRLNLKGVSLEDLRSPDFYTVDVSFIGNIDAIKHPEHSRRAAFLNDLTGKLVGRRLTYRFVDGRRMSFDDHIECFQKSRINLNFGCAADRYAVMSWGFPERCYGIPACGGFLLTEERVHAKDDFIVGDEIVMFEDIDDCIRKISYYIGLHDERRRIAENAHKRVIREHTYVHRAEKLMAAIKEIHNSQYISEA